MKQLDHNDPPMVFKLAILDYIQQHEQTCTTTGNPGTPCWGERCNLIAFLCHGLGIRGKRLYEDVARLLANYDQLCDDPTCRHEIN